MNRLLHHTCDKKTINETKAAYYGASEGWHENKNGYTPFIIYLLQVLYSCYRELDRRFVADSLPHLPKSKRIESMLMGALAPISKEEIVRCFPEISVTTIERVLGRMVRDGSIEQIGTFRDARYERP